MGSKIKLTASDGQTIGAYFAQSNEPVRGAVVVVQEIFGVNGHIRAVADGFANEGYSAIAPALFDRVEPDLELPYGRDSAGRGMAIATKLGMDAPLRDAAAAIAYLRELPGGSSSGRQHETKVAVVGYCYGGTLAWLAATRLDPAAAVGYYGGRIADYVTETPRCPVMLHFGSRDAHIPPAKIEPIQRLHPEVQVFLYDAGHGFNCDQRPDYSPEAANLARQRTLDFLKVHLAAE
ncbi:MAG: dienelactone hydrolase family protein [Terriglobales bacterium]